MSSFLKKGYVSFLIILAVVLATHSPLLLVNQLENPDAGWIYENLGSLQFPFEYFRALISFETFDFQPIRDISLYLDIWVFNKTGLVISVFLNCIVWAGACYQVLRILKKELKAPVSWQLLLLCLCFAVYPIFEPSINWGIARKHLLAFFFILSATSSLQDWEGEKKSILPVVTYYLLSLLSVPISIAWPAWVFLREGHFKGLRNPRVRSLIISLFFISLLVAGINFAYYKTSYVFLEIYPQKISVMDPLMVLVNLGFQFKQIILPYHTLLFYTFDKSAFIYFGLLSVLVLTLIHFSRSKKLSWMWPLFALPPMLVILSTPHLYYDTYVIVPAFAFFMFIATTGSSYLNRYAKFLIVPFLFWSVITFKQYKFWNDPYLSYEKAMSITPNCTNAQTLAARYLTGGRKLPNDLYEFIQLNRCLVPNADMTPSNALKTITFEAIILFYEDEIDFDYRESRLKELGSRSIYVMPYYMAFLAKTNQPDKLERLMTEQNLILRDADVRFPYDAFFSELVPEYCREHELRECQRFVERWQPKGGRLPYF